MRFIRSVVVGLTAVLVIAGAFWVGGFDFDKRGEVAAFCYFLCVLFGFWCFGISMMETSK